MELIKTITTKVVEPKNRSQLPLDAAQKYYCEFYEELYVDLLDRRKKMKNRSVMEELDELEITHFMQCLSCYPVTDELRGTYIQEVESISHFDCDCQDGSCICCIRKFNQEAVLARIRSKQQEEINKQYQLMNEMVRLSIDMPMSPCERSRLVEESTVKLSLDDIKEVCEVYDPNCKCEVCNIVINKIVNKKVVLEDIPLRNAKWAKKNKCQSLHHDGKCGVYHLVDWKVGNQGNKLSKGFLTNMKNFVKSGDLALNMRENASKHGFQIITKRDMKKIMSDVSGNPYIIYATRISDPIIGEYEGNEGFFARLYRVRVRLGLNGDYGYKNIVDMKAESDDEEETSGGFAKGIKWIFENIKGGFKNTVNGISQLVKSVMNKFFGLIEGMISLISGSFAKIIKKIKSMIIRIILKLVVPEHILKYIDQNKLKVANYVIIAVIMMGAMAVYMASMITMNVLIFIFKAVLKVKEFIRRLNGNEDEEKPIDMQAEGELDIMSIISSLLIAGFGLSMMDAETLRKRVVQMMSLMSGGTVMASAVAVLFCLLPSVLKTALVYKFGTEKMRVKYEIDDWRNMANSILALSRTQTVIGTEYYAEKVDEVMKSGSQMLKKLRGQEFNDVRHMFTNTYFRLLNLHMILTQKKYAQGSRKLPFCFHICGRPGIAKTVMSYPLIRAIYECTERDIYTRNCSDPYWSAFLNQKYILMDEFMEGSCDHQTEIGLEYLSLNSTGQFMPVMSSTDSPAVGIKGTIASPSAVISINNTAYDRPPQIDADAFQRRRKFVLEVEQSDEYRGGKNNVDLTSFDKEELANFSWAKFRLLPGQFSPDWRRRASPWMNFRTMIQVIKNLKDAHEQVCERLAEALGGGMSDNRSPEEIVNEVMRDSFELPTKPVTVTEAFFSLFTSESPMQAEGPKKSKVKTDQFGKRHTHYCCGVRIRHRQESGFWFCKVCKKQQDCNEANETDNTTDEEQQQLTTSTGKCTCGDCSECGYKTIKRESKPSECFCGECLTCKTKKKLDEDAKREKKNEDMKKCECGTCRMCVAKSNYSRQHGDAQHQSDILINCFTHEGCDPKVMHRHKCSVSTCDQHVGHRHEEIRHLPVFCRIHRDNPDLVYEEYVNHAKQNGERHPRFQNEDVPAQEFEDYMQAVFKRIYEDLDNIWNFYQPTGMYWFWEEKTTIKEHLVWESQKGVLIAAGIAALFAFAVYMAPAQEIDCNNITYGVQAESPPKDEETRERPRSRGKFERGVRNENYHAQSGQMVDVCKMTIGGRTINVVPIKEKWLLTFHHGLIIDEEPIADGTPMYLFYKGKNFEAKYNDQQTISSFEEDIAFIYFDCAQLPQFRDITKRFITEVEWRNVSSFQGCLRTMEFSKYTTVVKAQNRSYKYGKSARILSDCWRYKAQTNPGDCGIPLMVSTGPLAGKISGIHVAGSCDKITDPQGMSTIVTMETVKSALGGKVSDVDLEDVEMTVEGPYADFVEEMKALELDNLRRIEMIPVDMIVHAPNVTKIKPSILHERIGVKPMKAPPIMNSRDARSGGKDPALISIRDTLSSEQKEVDQDLVTSIYSTMRINYLRDLNFAAGKRQLTFEEACGGVPGVLSSLRTDTSPGYPLIFERDRPGKKTFVWFDEMGELQFTEKFRDLVFKKLEEMENYKEGDEIDHVFLGFLKDELLSEKKIKNCNTRMIYANDLICLVAFRMKFGAVLAACNNSFGKTPLAIGMNQYSYDMQHMFDYLSEVGTKFIASDYKSYDKRQQRQFRLASYDLIAYLSEKCGADKNSIEFMKQHEMFTPAQFGYLKFWTKNNHMSGCFWTTILNCFVNEGYMRYCFARKYPTLVFDRHIRMICLGDDHVLAMKEDILWTPKEISVLMLEIGQEYTSAFKDREIEDFQCDYDEVTFLGAHPRKLFGRWTGAMKKETLFETIQWTRDKNISLAMTCQQMMECSSQWGPEFYYSYCDVINQIFYEEQMPKILLPSWEEMARIVAKRDTKSGHHFIGWRAESEFVAEAEDGVVLPGLTTIKTSDLQTSPEYESSRYANIASHAINEQQLELQYGLNSFVYRTSFDWTSASGQGGTLWQSKVPFGLLTLGNPDNIQNMPFRYYIYCVTDVEIMFQINGTPTQAGAAMAYFMPLTESEPDLMNATTANNVMFSPCHNTTSVLKIPFRYFRSALNTFAGGTEEESLGTVFFKILSPLVTNTGSNAATVSVYTRFVNSKFTIARPIPLSFDRMRPTDTRWTKGIKNYPNVRAEGSLWQAEGSNVSTTTTNYNVGDVAGNVPIENITTSKNDQKVDNKLTAEIPMDNPPLGGGALPMMQQFPSMSRSNGLEPTIAMQFHQEMMHREPDTILDNNESSIESLCGRRSFWRNFKWHASDAEGAVLLTVPLNSVCFNPVNADVGGTVMPVCLAVLNQFNRWRADFVFDICAVRTDFHSGRLTATTAYGAPGIMPGEENIFLNTVLEYDGENSWQSVVVTYNAATEFLRTYEGSSANPVQDHSLGTLQLSVKTVLRSTSAIVSPDVDVMVFLSLKNVRVYDVNPFPSVYFEFGKGLIPFFVQPPVKDEEMKAEADEGIIVSEPTEVDNPNPDPVENTASESDLIPDRPCRLEIGRKYEYVMSNIYEVIRRHQMISYQQFPQEPSYDLTDDYPIYLGHMKLGGDTADGQETDVRALGVGPRNQWRYLFCGWSGHMKYRFYVSHGSGSYGMSTVSYMPSDSSLMAFGFDSVSLFFPAGKTVSVVASPIGTTFGKGPKNMNPMSIENMYPICDTRDFIDVSVPFNSHYNFVPTPQDTDDNANEIINNGFLVIRSASKGIVEMYEAAGDDFRFHIYRPPLQCRFAPFDYTPDVVVGPGMVAGFGTPLVSV